MPCFVLLGLAAGLGGTAIHVSRAPSYMSDDPQACMNCHIMGAAYLSWQHSSHGKVTVCNDCHVPHDSTLAKYAFKAQDGLRHATIFTLRAEPQVLELSRAAVTAVEDNCRRCHSETVAHTHAAGHQPGDRRCWDCHREVAHGVGRSLSAAPDTFRPALPGVLEDPRRLRQGDRPEQRPGTPTPGSAP
jgi:cytochrome c nitrite reductase small subunit